MLEPLIVLTFEVVSVFGSETRSESWCNPDGASAPVETLLYLVLDVGNNLDATTARTDDSDLFALKRVAFFVGSRV